MQRKSTEEKIEILERYRNGGMRLKQFCLEEGLLEQTVRNWIKKTELQAEQKQGFIEVFPNSRNILFHNQKNDIQTPVQKVALKLFFPQGIQIEIFSDSDRQTVAWVLNLLERRI